MSGGSYNYVYMTADDFSEVLVQRDDWAAIRDRLEGLGYDDIAAEVDAMLTQCNLARRRIEARAKRLEEVARAVEWMDSGDSGPERVAEAVTELRAGAE